MGGRSLRGTEEPEEDASLGFSALTKISPTGTRRSGMTTFSVAARTTLNAVTFGSAVGCCFRFSMPQVCGIWGGGCQGPGSEIYFKLTHYQLVQALDGPGAHDGGEAAPGDAVVLLQEPAVLGGTEYSMGSEEWRLDLLSLIF